MHCEKICMGCIFYFYFGISVMWHKVPETVVADQNNTLYKKVTVEVTVPQGLKGIKKEKNKLYGV